MTITRRTFVQSGTYQAVLRLGDLSQEEQEAVKRFGDPLIQVGGTFAGPPEFTRESQALPLAATAAFTYAVDVADHADAADRVVVWADATVVAIKAAIDTLRTQIVEDSFTDETLETY